MCQHPMHDRHITGETWEIREPLSCHLRSGRSSNLSQTDSHNSITRHPRLVSNSAEKCAKYLRGLIRTFSTVATMTRLLILSVVLGVCCALTEKTDFQTTTESTKKHSASYEKDRFLLENVAHARNSSQLIFDSKSDEEESKKTDKKPRTVIHRDANLDSRDKSMFSS